MKADLPRKKYIAITALARYFFFYKKEGDRLDPIAELSREYGLSVGILQSSLKFIEGTKAVSLQRKGHLGSYLVQIKYDELINFIDFNNLVCVMPLPYTKRYEGLATGIKSVFQQGVTLHYAFMRGAEIRIELLVQNRYDYALVSKLAANEALQQYDNLSIAAEFSDESYVQSHVLIKRVGKDISKLGVDTGSIDHLKLSESLLALNPQAKLVNVDFNEIESALKVGAIDAAIINGESNYEIEHYEIVPLAESDTKRDAKRAVLLCRNDDSAYSLFINRYLDIHQVIHIQELVMQGQLTPHY